MALDLHGVEGDISLRPDAMVILSIGRSSLSLMTHLMRREP